MSSGRFFAVYSKSCASTVIFRLEHHLDCLLQRKNMGTRFCILNRDLGEQKTIETTCPSTLNCNFAVPSSNVTLTFLKSLGQFWSECQMAKVLVNVFQKWHSCYELSEKYHESIILTCKILILALRSFSFSGVSWPTLLFLFLEGQWSNG